MGIIINKLQEEDYKKWDRFIKSNPNSTIFHTIGWKKIIEKTFGYKPDYLVLKNSDGEIIGVSPAFLIKKFFGKVIISQPFFEYGGPVVKKGFEEGYRDILNFYKKKVKNRELKYVEIKALTDKNDKYFSEAGFKKQFKAFDFFIDIKGKDFEKDIWSKLYTARSRVKNSVRKAVKKGVKIIEKDDIDLYYDIYLGTIERLGSVPFPKTLFENIKKYISPFVRFRFAYLRERPIAAMISFPYNGRDLMVSLVSDNLYYQYRANDLLYNQEIKYATESKFDIVDFGRTRPDSLYERYKRKWGATRINLYSYVYPPQEAKNIDPYCFYLLFSPLTKKNPLWKIFTRTKIGEYLVKRFP